MLKAPLLLTPLPKMVNVPPVFIVKLPPVPFKKTAVPPGIVGWKKLVGPVGVPIVTAVVATGGPGGFGAIAVQLDPVVQLVLVLPFQLRGAA
jgi:hypothetical protein